MRGDFFPYRGAPFGRPKPTLAPFLRGGTPRPSFGGDFAVYHFCLIMPNHENGVRVSDNVSKKSLLIIILGKYERIQKFMKKTYISVKSPPPKKGRFGPKFPDPRALPMRGDFFPHRGAPFGRPKPTLAPFLRGGTPRPSLGGLCCIPCEALENCLTKRYLNTREVPKFY